MSRKNYTKQFRTWLGKIYVRPWKLKKAWQMLKQFHGLTPTTLSHF